jgi:hypothetical protein
MEAQALSLSGIAGTTRHDDGPERQHQNNRQETSPLDSGVSAMFLKHVILQAAMFAALWPCEVNLRSVLPDERK